MDSIECPHCKQHGTPHLWHYQPFLLGKLRYLKMQHICRYCGVVMYESGGQITGWGWVCLTALGYLLGVFFLQRTFPKLGLTLDHVIGPILYIFVYGILFLGVRKLYRYFKQSSQRPK